MKMIGEDSIKNKKLSSIFYMEIAEILLKYNRNKNFLVTLTKVSVSNTLIKVYISIYPFMDKIFFQKIRSQSFSYRKELSKRLRYRVKKIPKLYFFLEKNDQNLG
ncbi:ribosome-binding factor A [Blattabacterium cuenoti]|uniref:ribosome-binding factor A n=1 Tax=Blattabacterium cuenoti TaxID=1653831 RepID=UPI001EEA7650|nr:ribosome-binding factor A [Blattabacterium cuenoti]